MVNAGDDDLNFTFEVGQVNRDKASLSAKKLFDCGVIVADPNGSNGCRLGG